MVLGHHPLDSSLKQRADVAVLLGLGVCLIVLRIPLAMQLAGLMAAVVIASQGVVWRRGLGLIVTFFALAVLSSGIATMMYPKTLLSGYFMMAVCYTLISVAVCFSGSVSRNVSIVVSGVYVGLWVHFAISLVELFSGIKFLPLRDPTSSAAPLVLEDPLLVTSLFVNYNDYAVAMVIFVNLLLAKLLFAAAQQRSRTIIQSIALAAAVALVIASSSRGALVSLVGSVAVEIVIVTRFVRPKLLSTRRLWILVAVAAAGFMALWNTSYFQDHSTQWRGQIAENIIGMVVSSGSAMFVGFGSAMQFAALGKVIYPGALLNPHNLMVELVMAYGFETLAVFLLCLLVLFWRAFIRGEVPMNSVGVAATTIGIAMPMYGSVPSSYLDYGYAFIFLGVATAAVALKRESLLTGALLSDEVAGGHHQDARQEGTAADECEPRNR